MIPIEISSHFHDLGWLLNWLPKIASYTAKKFGGRSKGRNEQVENKILDYLNTEVKASGIDGMWADVILKPIIVDVPFIVAFPTQLKGSVKLRHNLKKLPYEIRHRWRVMKQYVPEEEFQKILLKLIREKRIAYSQTTERYSSV